jgi:hypothetical protein
LYDTPGAHAAPEAAAEDVETTAGEEDVALGAAVGATVGALVVGVVVGVDDDPPPTFRSTQL